MKLSKLSDIIRGKAMIDTDENSNIKTHFNPIKESILDELLNDEELPNCTLMLFNISLIFSIYFRNITTTIISVRFILPSKLRKLKHE